VSLDVYLESVTQTPRMCTCSSCGNKHEAKRTVQFFSDNVTHNLAAMADAAGIYKELWRPEEVDIKTATQLIAPLEAGLLRLRADPDRFKKLNPDNGWGTYEGLVQFVSDYLEACRAHPDAVIRIWR